jgi:hypothetical protein
MAGVMPPMRMVVRGSNLGKRASTNPGAIHKTAVEEAQIALDLTVTGVLDDRTLKALNQVHGQRVYEWEQKSRQGRPGQP